MLNDAFNKILSLIKETSAALKESKCFLLLTDDLKEFVFAVPEESNFGLKYGWAVTLPQNEHDFEYLAFNAVQFLFEQMKQDEWQIFADGYSNK